jgi:hypothetical protein
MTLSILLLRMDSSRISILLSIFCAEVRNKATAAPGVLKCWR